MGDERVVEVMHKGDDLWIAHWGNVCFVTWRNKPTVEGATALGRHYLTLARKNPKGFFTFGTIEANVPNPDEPARKAISASMDAVEKHLLASAVAVEGTGFAVAALRAALATMSMLTRSRFPRKFFSTVGDAAAWMAKGWPELGKEETIAHAFAEFRRG